MTPAEFKEARITLGLTPTQCAAMLDYGFQSRISGIERGANPPGARVVRLMRAYLAGYRPDDWPKP